MKSSVEKLSATRTKITVEVPFEELKPEFDKAYASLAQQVNMPGFRKGKVPPKILEARLGRGVVLDQVINEMLPSRYSAAVDEHELKVLGQPEIEITELEDKDHVTFTAEVDVRPDIEVPDFSKISVEVEPLKSTEEAIDAELENLRARFGSLKPIKRLIKTGDFVTIDLSATIDGETVDEATTEGLSHEVGSDTLIKGLDTALRKLHAGEESTFTSKLVAGEHEGEEAEVHVKVQTAKERELPKLDDDFAQLASEFDTLDELRDSLKDQAEAEQKNAQAADIRDKVLAAALEETTVELSDNIVQAQVDSQVQQLIQQFGGDEKVFEEMLAAQGITREKFEEDARTSAEDSVRTQLFLDALADEEQPEVSQDELMSHISFTAAQYGMEPNQFIMQLQQANQLGNLFADVRRGKALALNIAKTSVKDTEGNEVDPKQYFGEDEAAESAEDNASENASADEN
ncbi:trigger factor [Corynebacterium sp. 320]|uniref:Trigger factor n=1 Tax=Corynebacterium zhongnanshanii TaxID=2768834 RepID=A0ABQ6VDI8_9CORY|nr:MULTISPECIES: trigger factor [Corynebacterium]KAB1502366.1 trigger factor [Corynebacterium sp. 320]KAB1551412.1 trigger factor [Corynebacterium sp. 321]KAB1551759.1 trigger factor [Corynebacterium sp. 319]KAB3520954.1 trigger factor [Corynebacterium zhongnanshanii]KAB3525973.1 trigger factor [Corynebacterium sp. 250]